MIFLPAGFITGKEEMILEETRMTLAQSDFVVTGAGPALLESDPDHFILAIPKHSTIFEKKKFIQIPTQFQVHNNLRHI